MPDGGRALITGANRGIGRHLALGLAESGLDVAVLGRRSQVVDEVAEACAEYGVRVVPVTADVVDHAQVVSAVTAAERELGGIDLLVNNAGVIEPDDRPFAEADVGETWRVVEVNVLGPMLVTHAVLPGMLRRGRGRIVNINSGAGHRPMTAYTGYAVSKGALARLTTQLDAQYRDRGIYAFDVAPGHIETDMTQAMPMHEGRTNWTPPAALVDWVLGVAAGRLDALAGRFFRAGTDTVDSLLVAADEIVDRDARCCGSLRSHPTTRSHEPTRCPDLGRAGLEQARKPRWTLAGSSPIRNVRPARPAQCALTSLLHCREDGEVGTGAAGRRTIRRGTPSVVPSTAQSDRGLAYNFLILHTHASWECR